MADAGEEGEEGEEEYEEEGASTKVRLVCETEQSSRIIYRTILTNIGTASRLYAHCRFFRVPRGKPYSWQRSQIRHYEEVSS